jgi:AAA15 family ATPase/GTPase
MLLQFAVENYLSFRDRAVLSMLADPRVTHEPGQVLEGPAGKQVLRAAAVYGANGSGKSNLVKALEAVQRMVHTGTRGDEPLPIVPFKLDPSRRDAPAHFELEVVAEGKHYSYGFEATAKQVTAEWLFEIDEAGEERPLFEREMGDGAPRLSIGDALGADPKRRAFLEFVAEGTRANQLFLAEAGERNVKELGPVRAAIGEWRVVQPDKALVPLLLDKIEKLDTFREVLSQVLREAGTGIEGLRVSSEPVTGMPTLEAPFLKTLNEQAAVGHRELRLDEQGRATMAHLKSIHRSLGGEQVELDFTEESDGTRRLLNLAPIVYLADAYGQDPLFAIDELERSLHPLLTRMLLQLFFSRAGSATAGTQLIFTTHDTNLLDRGILSRDSIWLMEKDARGGSVMYPLSDLDKDQVDEVDKQGQGLEKAYLRGRFGAIPFFGSLEALGMRKEDLK